MKRKIGWLIVMLFGLTMLMEVAVLPLFTSFASKFECSVIAELTDFEEQEKLESLSELQLAIVAILPEFQLFTTEEPLELAGNPKIPISDFPQKSFLNIGPSGFRSNSHFLEPIQVIGKRRMSVLPIKVMLDCW